MPTFPYQANDPLADAHTLYKSMKGLGTDDSTLINVMTHRSKQQLEQIALIYAKEHKNSLEKDIKGDTSGNYCKLLCDIAKPVLVLKTEFLQSAVRGLGTRESIVIDVITQSSNAEIMAMKNLWPNMEKDICGDTSGNFRHVLVELMKAKRQEITVIDDQLAVQLAHDLYKAGENRLGTNDSKFVEIMTSYSPYFLDRVSHHYSNRHGHSLQKAIENETSGHYKDALIACTRPPDVYFAHRLHRAIKGLGTDDTGLIYCFSIHDKGQLQHIAKLYESRGLGSLHRDVEKDTSGNYRKTLLSLLT
jgi:hypothetical protein